MKFSRPKCNKIPKKDKVLATHVDWLVRLYDLWAQCTWVSLSGLTEKVMVGQVDLTQIQKGHNLLLLGIRFAVKVYGLLKFKRTVAQV